MEWLTWVKEVLVAFGVKRDMLAPTFSIAVALYFLFVKRFQKLEERMTKVETLASEVDVVESRTRDIWELLMNMQPKSSPYSGVVSATPVESMLIRENDRQRERASRKSQNRNR